MNKHQEALDKLDELYKCDFCENYSECNKNDFKICVYYNLIQNLVDKITPYIPLDLKIKRRYNIIIRLSGTCKCGLHYSLSNELNDLEDTYYNGFHCSKCGQKLKWKEENNV